VIGDTLNKPTLLTRAVGVLLAVSRRGKCRRCVFSVLGVVPWTHAQAVTQRRHAQETRGRAVLSGERSL
jgi:hypothetical protein